MTSPDRKELSLNTFKPPIYIASDPKLWFSLLECNFKSNRMTSSLTKFNQATSVLPSDVLSHVADVISQASTADQPYETLKEAVITRFQASQTQRLQELLSREELGAEKPTQLLLRMKRLIGETYEHFDKQLFLELFYQRLPNFKNWSTYENGS